MEQHQKNVEILLEKIEESNAILVCAASNPKYKALFMDESLSHYILNKLFQIQKPQRIPEIMKEYHVTEWEAEKLLLFMLNGNFAVNKSLGWNRSSDWYRIQNITKV